MAYLGLADEARRIRCGPARSHDDRSRFPAFWGPNYDWVPDQDHGSILLKTVQAMLMQTDGRKIYLLPAWPADWDVRFKLHAPYRTVVEGEYRGGKLVHLSVTPESRRSDVVILRIEVNERHQRVEAEGVIHAHHCCDDGRPMSVVHVLMRHSRPQEPARRPNVLFLLTDDQRADTIAALGNPVIKTPNLDRLARAVWCSAMRIAWAATRRPSVCPAATCC